MADKTGNKCLSRPGESNNATSNKKSIITRFIIDTSTKNKLYWSVTDSSTIAAETAKTTKQQHTDTEKGGEVLAKVVWFSTSKWFSGTKGLYFVAGYLVSVLTR